MKWLNQAIDIFHKPSTQGTAKTAETSLEDSFSSYRGGSPKRLPEIKAWLGNLSFLLGIDQHLLLDKGFLSDDDISDLLDGTLTTTPELAAHCIKNSEPWLVYITCKQQRKNSNE